MQCDIDSEEKFNISTKLIGAYNAENVLSAVAIGEYFGLEKKQIKEGLEKYVPLNNRSQLTVTEHNKLVVDTYNANPTSMRAAILNFAQMNVDSKILILGDMLELGEQSSIEHQNIIQLLQQNKFENVLLVGNNFGNTNNSYLCFGDATDLINYLNNQPIRNKYVLIKGSRGIKLEKVVPLL
jgi:UDP-N-acetylmuramoyl-tripeptide--D-alanyl-D-alanine ligase